MSSGIRRIGFVTRVSDAFWQRPRMLLLLLLALPVLWFLLVCVLSLAALVLQTFFAVDDISGRVDYTLTLSTYKEVFSGPNLMIIIRTFSMALVVAITTLFFAFPIAFFTSYYTRGWSRILFYTGIMLALWSGSLTKTYAWKLILSPDGVFAWVFEMLHLNGSLETSAGPYNIGSETLMSSPTGTFLVLFYIALPFMILPIHITLTKLPISVFEASGDLGARPFQTFWHVALPLAMPGVIVGVLLTFSLVLGDYVVPQLLSSDNLYIGQMIYQNRGEGGNLPLAAAFTIVPLMMLACYIWWANRRGVFDAV